MEIEFLTEYFKAGVGYNSVNYVRSALSSILKPLCNVHLENRLWYANFSKGFFILGQPCQDILQIGMSPKFLLFSSQNQLLQIVI